MIKGKLKMVINIAFFVVIALSVIRTIAYGIYAFKNEGIGGGISVFVLAAGSISTAVIIFMKQIIQ